MAGQVELAVADLTKDAGWTEAAAGCDYVLHTASPVGDFSKTKAGSPESEALIESAIQGTMRAVQVRDPVT